MVSIFSAVILNIILSYSDNTIMNIKPQPFELLAQLLVKDYKESIIIFWVTQNFLYHRRLRTETNSGHERRFRYRRHKFCNPLRRCISHCHRVRTLQKAWAKASHKYTDSYLYPHPL